MKKKIVIITVIVLVILTVSVLLVLLLNRKAKNTSQISVQTSQPASPSLPGLSNLQTLHVQDPHNMEEVKNQFQAAVAENISSNTKKERIKWFSLKDREGQLVSLDDFLKANNARIGSKVEGFLDKNDYEFFYCPNEKGGKDFGIALYVNPQGFYPNRYSDIMAGLKEWEPTLLLDFHSVIFPNVSFSESDLQQKLAFRDGKYRFSELVLPGGEKSSINYENFGDAVVITSSVECLDTVSSIIAPLQE